MPNMGQQLNIEENLFHLKSILVNGLIYSDGLWGL